MNAEQIKSFKAIRTKLLKVAQDELDLTKQIPNGESGPQEVVDAVAEIASDLEEVIDMIPAEPSSEEGVDIDDQEPQEGAEVKPEDPIVDPEKDLMQAKIAELEKKIDTNEKDVIANKIAELYGGSKDIYDRIMADNKPASFHAAQLDTIEDFVKNAKTERKTQIAQDFSSYVKVAQLSKKESKRKML